MGYENHVASKVKITSPNCIYLSEGGQYNLDEGNELEARMVKIHLLQHLLDIAAAALCDSNEMVTLFGTRFENLAEELYECYKPFIEKGINIFEYDDYYMHDQLKKYAERPLVKGGMNASPAESTPGLPEGWWYEYQGIVHKYFSFGHVAIDYYDNFLRINTYDGKDFEEGGDPANWIHITEARDYGELFLAYPDDAVEIAAAAKFIEQEANPQI